jgi:hypothetical protein
MTPRLSIGMADLASKVPTMADDLDLNCNNGTAALGICESLLLALTDLKVVSEEDVRGLLTDVATANTEAAAHSHTPGQHHAVAEIVRRILAGKNGLRH